jgi:triacylglycerol lipase
VLPVVLVHGIWDSARRIAPLTRGLGARGFMHLKAMDLTPPWGNARLEALAEQVHACVAAVRRDYGCEQVDIVGFSMGGLVTRAYLALLGGHVHVRKFVSISAPHQGTLAAYAMPLDGVRQMRPGSALISELEAASLGDVVVHCIYTPYDAMIVPGTSGILAGARSVHALPVKFHRWMLSDARVHDLVAELLRA